MTDKFPANAPGPRQDTAPSTDAPAGRKADPGLEQDKLRQAVTALDRPADGGADRPPTPAPDK